MSGIDTAAAIPDAVEELVPNATLDLVESLEVECRTLVTQVKLVGDVDLSKVADDLEASVQRSLRELRAIRQNAHALGGVLEGVPAGHGNFLQRRQAQLDGIAARLASARAQIDVIAAGVPKITAELKTFNELAANLTIRLEIRTRAQERDVAENATIALAYQKRLVGRFRATSQWLSEGKQIIDAAKAIADGDGKAMLRQLGRGMVSREAGGVARIAFRSIRGILTRLDRRLESLGQHGYGLGMIASATAGSMIDRLVETTGFETAQMLSDMDLGIESVVAEACYALQEPGNDDSFSVLGMAPFYRGIIRAWGTTRAFASQTAALDLNGRIQLASLGTSGGWSFPTAATSKRFTAQHADLLADWLALLEFHEAHGLESQPVAEDRSARRIAYATALLPHTDAPGPTRKPDPPAPAPPGEPGPGESAPEGPPPIEPPRDDGPTAPNGDAGLLVVLVPNGPSGLGVRVMGHIDASEVNQAVDRAVQAMERATQVAQANSETQKELLEQLKSQEQARVATRYLGALCLLIQASDNLKRMKGITARCDGIGVKGATAPTESIISLAITARKPLEDATWYPSGESDAAKGKAYFDAIGVVGDLLPDAQDVLGTVFTPEVYISGYTSKTPLACTKLASSLTSVPAWAERYRVPRCDENARAETRRGGLCWKTSGNELVLSSKREKSPERTVACRLDDAAPAAKRDANRLLSVLRGWAVHRQLCAQAPQWPMRFRELPTTPREGRKNQTADIMIIAQRGQSSAPCD
ncbi:MAG: hypothetical protein F9K40_00905 [Kofleriaceae bacterium]|nr:MAG: hypothetical protein F9K40_00905 [Kofleriaceae bacterium]MBZ0234865.1 hypothetical protein [Kofleriaceae bacterium]